MEISERNIGRHHLLRMVLDGHLPLTEASEKMGVSYRQAKRLRKSFGVSGVPDTAQRTEIPGQGCSVVVVAWLRRRKRRRSIERVLGPRM